MIPAVLETPRLELIIPDPELALSWRAYVTRNREHFRASMPSPPADYFTEDYWKTRLQKAQDDAEAGTAFTFALMVQPEGDFIGDCTFDKIIRGPLQSCFLGYKLDQDFEGHGFMQEALERAIRFMFEEQKLHRIQAAYRPKNERSGRLLTRLGFTVEGHAKDYLFLDGAWRDHVLTAKLNPDYRFDQS